MRLGPAVKVSVVVALLGTTGGSLGQTAGGGDTGSAAGSQYGCQILCCNVNRVDVVELNCPPPDLKEDARKKLKQAAIDLVVAWERYKKEQGEESHRLPNFPNLLESLDADLRMWWLERQVADPPDFHFRVIRRPLRLIRPRIPADGPRTAAAAAAHRMLLKLVEARMTEAAFGEAFVTAVERGWGAHIRRNTVWQRRQLRQAGRYARRIRLLLRSELSLVPKAARALAAIGFTTLTITASQAGRALDELRAHHLPEEWTSAARKLDGTGSIARAGHGQVGRLDPGDVAGMRDLVPHGKRFRIATGKQIDALQRFAVRVDACPLCFPAVR